MTVRVSFFCGTPAKGKTGITDRSLYMIRHLIDVAAGREKADLVLKNGSYVNVFSGTIEKGDIAIAAGKIVGVGE